MRLCHFVVVVGIPVVVLGSVGVESPTPGNVTLRSWRVRYLMRTEKEVWNFEDVLKDEPELLEDLSKADDTPMAAVLLNFDFPFFGQGRRVAFVNANGAIGFDPTPPCGTYFGSVGVCSLNTSWYDLVAGFVTDLNPAAQGQIYVSQAPQVLTAAYENVTLYGANHEARDLNMAMSLHSDGRVEIRHHRVFEKDDLGVPMIVGLRGPPDDELWAVTEPQEARKGPWHTSVPGVYAGAPPEHQRRTIACPVPSSDLEFCAEIVVRQDLEPNPEQSSGGQDNQLGASGPKSNVLVVEIVAPFFGCAAEVDMFGFFCALVSDDEGDRVIARSSHATFRNVSSSAVAATCDFNDSDDADAAREALENAVLVASAKQFNTTTNATAAVSKNDPVMSIKVELRYVAEESFDVFDHGDGDGGFPTETREERSVSGSSIALTTILEAPAAGEEFFVEVPSSTDDPDGSGYVCTSRWLKNVRPYPLPVLDCAKTPTTENVGFVDEAGTCCDYRETDCLGECGGNAVSRPVGNNGVQCCNFDCKGDCNGAAIIDDCGVCGGQNNDKDLCGVCFGTATTSCPNPPTPAPNYFDDDEGRDDADPTHPDHPNSSGDDDGSESTHKKSSSSSKPSRVASSVHDHPWVVVIVALEIFVSIACFRSCTSRRLQAPRETPRDYDAAWAESNPDFPAGTTLAPRDLDNLVHTALEDRLRTPDALPQLQRGGSYPRRFRTSSTLLLFSASSRPSQQQQQQQQHDDSEAPPAGEQEERPRRGATFIGLLFNGRTPNNNNNNNNNTAPPQRDVEMRPPMLTGSGFVFGGSLRASVAEAYQGAITALCATPTNQSEQPEIPDVDDEENPDEEAALCGICLDELRDHRVVSLPNCGHTFHAACLSPWLTAHNSCPFCKRTVVDRVYPQLGLDDDDDPPDADHRRSRRRSRRRRRSVEMRSLGGTQTDESRDDDVSSSSETTPSGPDGTPSPPTPHPGSSSNSAMF